MTGSDTATYVVVRADGSCPVEAEWQRMIAEKHQAFIFQATLAYRQLQSAPGEDRFWGDRTAGFVAAMNAYHAAQLGLELVVLQEAVSKL